MNYYSLKNHQYFCSAEFLVCYLSGYLNCAVVHLATDISAWFNIAFELHPPGISS